MLINYLDLDDNVCNEILTKKGYVIEEVKAKYPLDGGYHENNDKVMSYGEVKVRVAYKNGKKPVCLKNMPLLCDIKQYQYEKVLGRLICDKIYELMLS